MTFANEDKFFNKKQKDFKRFELSTSNSVTHKLPLTLEKLIWIQLKISLISQVHKGPPRSYISGHSELCESYLPIPTSTPNSL